MEHLKNIGMGAVAVSFVVLAMALAAAILVLCLGAADVLARHWPGTGPAVLVVGGVLALLWAIGRAVRP